MPAGTRREGLATRQKRIDLPIELIYRFEKLPQNFNPATQEPIFGVWSQRLSELLEAYIIQEELKLAQRKAA